MKTNIVLTPCEVCAETMVEDRYTACEDCCEHEFDSEEGFMCLGCGKEGAEDVMAAAYDRAKAARYDGDY